MSQVGRGVQGRVAMHGHTRLLRLEALSVN